MTEYY